MTDLMQGPVYGVSTEESLMDARLKTIFNYDEIFGTIINRFVVQAVIGYPLTVYGGGGQTRGYINIRDTIQCVHAAEKCPPQKGEMKIFNQIMETFSVNQLAELTKKVGDQLGYDVRIKSISNLRKESESHYYNPQYHGLKKLGVVPNLLTEESLGSLFQMVDKYSANIRREVIYRGVSW